MDSPSIADDTQLIRDNLKWHKQFVLATVDDQNNPWAVCLDLTLDSYYNIIWLSDKTI
jgi:hypothetical protein